MTAWRRRILRLVAASALLTAAALAFLPTGSGAEEPTVVGWWYRDVPLSADASMQAQATGRPVVADLGAAPASSSQVPPPTLPPAPVPTLPPEVTVPDPGQNAPTPSAAPDGGLLVAADVTGVRAMSALRFDVPDAGGAILRLTVATGSTPSPGIRACPALSDWLPGGDQAWSARPAHDCDRVAVSSTLSVDRTTMQWDLPDTFKSPDSAFYDVVLVPLGGDGTPFEVAFEKPGADAFTVTSPAPEIEPPVYEPPPDDIPPPIDTFSSDGYDFGNVGGSFADVPVDTGGLEPTGSGRTLDRPPFQRLADALENPTTRRIAALALIALGAYAYRESGRTIARAPQLLGALAGGGQRATTGAAAPRTAPARGIGRFSRQRHGPAGRL